MKKQKTFIAILYFFVSLLAQSQNNCSNYLNDFVPKATDSVLEINVNFIIFTPTVGTSVWASATPARADQALRIADSMLANIPAPKAAISGVAQIPQAKIKFKQKSLSFYPNHVAYTMLHDPQFTIPYVDSAALNLFFGFSSFATSIPGAPPSLIGNFPANGVADIGSEYLGRVMSHELCHMLGVDHADSSSIYDPNPPFPQLPGWYGGTGRTKIYPTFECCTELMAKDYIEEDSLIFKTCPMGGGTNNLMNRAAGCPQYLSPQQMALIHYHLRTDLKNILVAHSFNSGIGMNPASNVTATAPNETWTTDRYLKGDLIVKAGAKLTISCLLGMTNNSRIIVERGAVLTVLAGTITNISGQLWNGIQVAGDPNADQSINSNGFSAQGILRVTNGGVISNAGNAAMNYSTGLGGTIDWSSIGGIIIGDYGYFLNNKRDVEFLAYDYPSGSYFRFCEFKTLRKLNNGQPAYHVTMWGTRGINFYGCNFEYAAGSAYVENSRGTGILSMDANYNVDKANFSAALSPSTFKSMSNGVLLLNSNVIHTAVIKNSRFEDITGDAVYFKNSNHFNFTENYIRTPNYYLANGFYVNTCKYYTIKNTTFAETNNGRNTSGLHIWNSGDGAHQAYRNNFSGFGAAIIAEDNNCGYNNLGPGLKMNCNDFTPSANEYDIAMLGFGTGLNAPTVMKNQGMVTSPTSTNVVRNMYSASCIGLMNKWYVSGSGTNTLTINHGSNSNFNGNASITRPLPQPSCSSPVLNVSNSGIALDYTAHCTPYPPNTNQNSPLSSFLSYYNNVVSMQRTPGNRLDTFELQTAISGKIDVFMRDSLVGSADSIIALLTNNHGKMSDASIQLAFAYINKKDFAAARVVIDQLTGQNDWKTLITTLIDVYQNSKGIYSIKENATWASLLEDYANHPEKSGSGIAQNILFFVNGMPFSEPRTRPGGAGGARFAQTALKQDEEKNTNVISLHPNPAKHVISLTYNSDDLSPASVEIRDLLGSLVHKGDLQPNAENQISISRIENGLYFITVIKNEELLYQKKLIKQND